MVELFIEGQRVDLSEAIGADITYSLADIRTPDKRQVNYSKTLTLAGTIQNNYIFGYIYNIDVENEINPDGKNVGINYNPKKLAAAQLFSDGVLVFDGTLRLWRVIVKGKDVSYEVSLFGKLFDIFSAMGESKLSDLDVSALNHAYTWPNIIQTWQSGYNGAFLYPLIDFGTNIQDNAGRPSTIKFGSLVPCLRYRYLLDRIFASINSLYTLNFTSLSIFNRLIVTPPITDVTGSPNFFTAIRNTPKTHAISDPDRMPGNGDRIGVRLGNVIEQNAIGAYAAYSLTQFGTATGEKFVLNQPLTTSFQYKLNYTLSVDPQWKQDFPAWSVPNTNVKLEVIHYNADDTENTVWFVNSFWNPISNPTALEAVLEIPTHDYAVNDYIVVNFRGITQGINIRQNAGCSIRATSPSDLTEYPLIEGGIINMSRYLPSFKMVDFVKDFIKLFNLFVTQDPTNPSRFIFTPQKDFYKTNRSNAVSWTDKLDYDQPIIYTPVSQLTAKQYLFTWKQDKDYWSELYFSINREVYGQLTFVSDTDVVNNTETVESIYSPAVMQCYTASQVICPAIYKVETQGGITTRKPDKFNTRLLIWGGLFSAGHSIALLDSDGNTYQSVTNYPYAGHLDKPVNPTFDLNFGNTNTSLPTAIANQFNTYWFNTLIEASSKDGKLMSCTMLLKAYDIEILDFSALYKVDNHYFRLNKIEGFNPFEISTCKVELIKVVTA